MKYIFISASVAVIAAGCAARSTSGETQPAAAPEPVVEQTDPRLWRGDPRLYNVLNVAPLGPAQLDSIALYAREHGETIDANLGIAARDTRAPTYVRLNALHILGTRQARAQLPVFREAIDDDDVRVRATAVASLREYMKVVPLETLKIVRLALRDENGEVQAQSLQIIADRDPALLRDYMRFAANDELRKVARDLITIAEERGAPAPVDSAGVIRRVTSQGHTIIFEPSQRWPEWKAAYGSVRIERAGQPPVQLRGIEAVAGVVPVFFSTDGSHLVYERDRSIVERNMQTGAERVIAEGIAPRLLPFTNDFVYLREVPDSRLAVRERTRIRYEVMRVTFGSRAEPALLGATGVFTSHSMNGNYSPARWVHVEEHGGAFFLVGDTFEMFALPDPFG